jgi:uncharacterized protein (DUF1800 family)
MRIFVGSLEIDFSGTSSRLDLESFVFALTVVLAIAGCGGNKGSSVPEGSLGITAANDTVRAGENDQFAIQGSNGNAGTWKVSGGATNGSIDSNGLFHAPTVVPQPNLISINYTANGQTSAHSIQILNPVPVVNVVAPTVLRSAISTITVSGSKFAKGAVVLVNGNAVPTIFTDSGHLLATVTAAQVGSTQFSVAVNNPDPGTVTGTSVMAQAAIQPISVSPSSVGGGNVSLSLSSVSFSPDLAGTINGYDLNFAATSDSSVVSASGFLPPWHTGTATLRIFSKSTANTLAEIQLPIAPTAVSFDTAARFLTQAGFGPNPSLTQRVQAVGLEEFIAEQQATPIQSYPQYATLADILNNSVSGPTPLRMRVAFALQTFLVRAGITQQWSNIPFELKMEKDSTGNFRDLLTDVASDVSIARILNLAGNAASRDPNVHPNQNFARELLQLYTIGTVLLNDDGTTQTNLDGSPIPAYNQDTILDLSRAFTGWDNPRTGNPDYILYEVDWSAPLVDNEYEHDKGQKLLFGKVSLPAGQTAAQDRDMALDAIFAHPNLPPFVSRILIQRLVKSNPSPEYVRRITTVFKDDGRGVRGNLSAVVRAILLDPEARSGDTSHSSSDGFVQEPYLFETFFMNITGVPTSDGQPIYMPRDLGEPVFNSPTVFGLFSPSYDIPGTSINSPEFQILNNITLINRSQVLWALASGKQPGFHPIPPSSWLYGNFKSIPQLVEALNHLAYHGQMPIDQQNSIISFCSQVEPSDASLAREYALFLAMNDDNYTVIQ